MPLDPTQPSSGRPVSSQGKGYDLAGTFLDQVELLRELGEGSSAIVYEGIDHRTAEKVAIKVLKNAQQTAAVDRDRFMDELRVSHRLSHAHLVTAQDGGISHGFPYLVMRLASRGSLQDILDRGPLSKEETVAVIAQVGSALDAIHDQGLVHRDVKPGNVLVDETAQGTAYLLTDMGIIQPLSPNVKMHPGTIGYSAPEQLLSRLVDRRADVFSLACLAYACLTGAPPWHRSTVEETQAAVLEEPVPSISSLRSGLPETVQPVFERALAKSPVDRHRTADAFVQAISKSLEDSVEVAPQVGGGPGSPMLRHSMVWLTATCLAGSLGVFAAILGLISLEPLMIGLAVLGLSAASYLLFRPRYIVQLEASFPVQELLESVAINLRRNPGWTSRPSRQGEVAVESSRGKPKLAALLPFTLLGVLPALTAGMAMMRPSWASVKVVSDPLGGTRAEPGPLTLQIKATGLSARKTVNSLLLRLEPLQRRHVP